jgi:hypothetical protein
VGYGILVFASAMFFAATVFLGGSSGDDAFFRFRHLGAALLFLAVVPGVILVERAVPTVGPLELRFLKLLTAGALVEGLAWSAAEVGLLARDLLPRAEVPVVGPALTSAAWTVLAILVFAVGWGRGSPYLRWLGIATLGLTLLKFLLVDLARVDAFWRFVTAIAVGCVLLALSYVYQKARRRLPAG